LQETLRRRGPGQWVVTVILPTGTRLTQRLSTDVQGNIDVTQLLSDLADTAGKVVSTALPQFAQVGRRVRDGLLRSAIGVVQDIDWSAVGSYLLANSVGRIRQPETSTTTPLPSYIPQNSLRHPDAQLRFFRGSVLAGDVTEIRPDQVKIDDDGAAKCVSGRENELLIVQLLRPEIPTSNLLLPPGATLRLSRRGRGTTAVGVAVSFNDSLADQAVQLRARTGFSELTTVGTSLTDDEIRSLGARPTGAAICLMYLVLRTRDAASVNSALDGLLEAAANSPDATVIRAELEARAGDYKATLRDLLETIERGTPYIGQGVTFLADRLSLCAKFTEWSDAERQAILAALHQIEPFSANCDYAAPVTTYNGLHPAKPGSTRLSRAEFLGTTGFPITSS
jgi:hypothetical protein